MNFSPALKKTILLIIFFLFSIFLGYLLYLAFFKTTPPKPTDIATSTDQTGFPYPVDADGKRITEPTQPGDIPKSMEKIIREKKPDEKAMGGITKTTNLNSNPSSGITIAENGKDLNYYDKKNNQFYTIDKDGNIKELSNKKFYNVENVTWSPQKNKAIIEYPDGANIIYNFKSEEQITLPNHWKDFNFSPNGDKIIMKSIGMDPNNRWLGITNENGSRFKIIEELGEKDETVYTNWSPNNQLIAMYTEGIDFNRQEVYFIGQNNENFKSTVIEGRGFQPKWSPSGKQLMYSVYSSDSDLKPNLWVVNAQGDSIGSGRKQLHINTWANKCTYANDSELYCAIPQSLERGAGIFPELSKNTIDDLYRINTKTGTKRLIATPDKNFNISNLTISEDEKNIFFTDETTSTIHKIKLK